MLECLRVFQAIIYLRVMSGHSALKHTVCQAMTHKAQYSRMTVERIDTMLSQEMVR